MTASLLLLLLGAAFPLETAERLLKEARFEDVATALAPLLADGHAPLKDRARGEVLLGLALHNLQDADGARGAFRKALEFDREITLPERTSPRTATLFNEVKATLPPLVRELPPPSPPLVGAQVPVASPQLEPAPLPQPRTEAVSWLRPTRTAGLVGAGLSVVSGVMGGWLLSNGITGRQLALTEPVALTSQAQFERANASFGLGQALLVTTAAVLVVSIVLFLLPGTGAP